MFAVVSPERCVLRSMSLPVRSQFPRSSFASTRTTEACRFRNGGWKRKRGMQHFVREEREFLMRCIAELSSICETEAINYSCSGRVKSFTSVCQKMRRRSVGYGDILDRIGLRIVVRNIRECYRLLARIRLLYPHRTNSIRDYVANPKGNGYRSLHVSIRSHEQRTFEVQIRTVAMDTDSLRGRASHLGYKSEAALARK